MIVVFPHNFLVRFICPGSAVTQNTQFVIHCGRTLVLSVCLSIVNIGNLYCKEVQNYDTGEKPGFS